MNSVARPPLSAARARRRPRSRWPPATAEPLRVLVGVPAGGCRGGHGHAPRSWSVENGSSKCQTGPMSARTGSPRRPSRRPTGRAWRRRRRRPPTTPWAMIQTRRSARGREARPQPAGGIAPDLPRPLGANVAQETKAKDRATCRGRPRGRPRAAAGSVDHLSQCARTAAGATVVIVPPRSQTGGEPVAPSLAHAPSSGRPRRRQQEPGSDERTMASAAMIGRITSLSLAPVASDGPRAMPTEGGRCRRGWSSRASAPRSPVDPDGRGRGCRRRNGRRSDRERTRLFSRWPSALAARQRTSYTPGAASGTDR